LVRDNDRSYAQVFLNRLRSMGFETAARQHQDLLGRTHMSNGSSGRSPVGSASTRVFAKLKSSVEVVDCPCTRPGLCRLSCARHLPPIPSRCGR
jgi:hypothetical protein